MKKAFVINLVLFSVLLGLYFYLNQDVIDEPLQSISTIHPDDINIITIEKNGHAALNLIQHNAHWQIDSPFSAPANHTRIQLLLSLLSQPIYRQQTIKPEQDMTVFGFHEHSMSLILNHSRFIFGDIDPLHHYRYVRHQNKLYLLEDTVYPLLNSAATNFIDNQLLAKNTILTSLTLPLTQEGQISDQTITLNKIDGQWHSSPPRSMDKLTTLIDHWHYAQAMQVIPLSQYHNTENNINASWNTKHGKSELAIKIDSNNVMITNFNAGLVYQFPHAIYQQLLLPIE